MAIASSFQKGVILGGACRNEDLITFLFDAVYGLGFLANFYFMCEKLFGFGKKKTELVDDPDNPGKKIAIVIEKFILPTVD